jgi:hypothetical protein
MFGRLPPSFFEAWQTNRERNVARELRNADDLYVLPHPIELFKRTPLISFATTWNSIDERKNNLNQKVFLTQMKSDILAGIVV